MTSGNVPVFSCFWFDSGYMFASAHEVMHGLWSSSWPGCGGFARRCATTGVDVVSGGASTSSLEFVDIPLRNRDRYTQVQFLAVLRRDEVTNVVLHAI